MIENFTTTQIVTIVLIVAYLIWEIAVRKWSKSQPSTSGAVIRVDLLLIYPVLLIMIIISLYKYFK